MRRRLGRWLAAAVAIGLAAALVALLLLARQPPAPAAGKDSALGSATAAPPPPDAVDPVGLVASAKAAASAGDFASARALLLRAYALDRQPSTLLALASAELRSGHCREALRAARRVAAEAAEPLAGEAHALVEQIGRCD